MNEFERPRLPNVTRKSLSDCSFENTGLIFQDGVGKAAFSQVSVNVLRVSFVRKQ